MSNRSPKQMNRQQTPRQHAAISQFENTDKYTQYDFTQNATSATKTQQSQSTAVKEKNISDVSLQSNKSNESGYGTDSSRTDLKQPFKSSLYSVQENYPEHFPNLEGQKKMPVKAVSPVNQESSTSSLRLPRPPFHQCHGRIHSLPHVCHTMNRRWSLESHHCMCETCSSGSIRLHVVSVLELIPL